MLERLSVDYGKKSKISFTASWFALGAFSVFEFLVI